VCLTFQFHSFIGVLLALVIGFKWEAGAFPPFRQVQLNVLFNAALDLIECDYTDWTDNWNLQ